MNIARSSFLRLLADVFGKVVKVIGLFYFSRILGPSLIGTFFLFQAAYGVLTTFTDLDISSAVSKRISEGDDIDAMFWTAVALKTAPILGISVAGYLVASVVNQYLGANLTHLLILQVVLAHFSRLTRNVLEGELRVGETALPLLLRQVIFVGAGVVFVWLDYGVFGLVYGLILGTVVETAVNLSLSSVSFSSPSRAHARSLFDFFKYSFVTAGAYKIFNWTDVFLIGLFLTQSAVGIYEIPWRITVVALFLNRALGTAIFPQISEWDTSENDDRIRRLVSGSLAISMYLVLPSFVGLVFVGQEILLFVFGPEYLEGWLVLVIVSAIRIVEATGSVFRIALQAINQPSSSARTEVLSVSLNVVLNVVFISQFGIVGAAVASFISVGFKAGLNGWYLSQFIPVVLPVRRIGLIILSALGMGGVVFLLQNYNNISTLFELAFVVVCGIVIYAGCTLLFRPLRQMVFENVRRIIA